MRMIGFVNDENDARRFCDYLLTQQIAAHAEQMSGGAWQVWIENDDQLDAGAAELVAFRADRQNAKYDATGQAEKLRKLEYRARQKRQQNFRDVRTTMFAPPTAASAVTMIVIGLATVVFLLTRGGVGGNGQGGLTPGMRLENALLFDNLHRQLNDANAGVTDTVIGQSRWAMFHSLKRGEVWRLVTPAFLHADWLHLIFNMLWMLDLGRRIESVKGSVKLAVLVLVIAVLSNLAQAGWAAVSPFDPNHYSLFLGMSGVVAGLFGYAWVCGRMRPYERVGVSQQEAGYMIGWLVICSFGLVGPIANAAHWGGLAVGAGLGALPSVWKRR